MKRNGPESDPTFVTYNENPEVCYNNLDRVSRSGDHVKVYRGKFGEDNSFYSYGSKPMVEYIVD
jgi:hypothetical protein